MLTLSTLKRRIQSYCIIGSRGWVLGATLFIFATASAAELNEQDVDAFAQPQIGGGLCDGVSIGVILPRRSFTVHLGQASQSIGSPTDETLYEIGSMTKVFTSLLLATLVQDGSIKLSDPANVDDSPLRLVQSPGKPIRWIDLATHTSGLPRLPDNMTDVAGDNPYAEYDTSKAAKFLSDYQPSTAPGERHEYSNLGFAALGRLVADAAGTQYPSMLQDRIADPLGMQSCVIELTDENRQHLATPHSSAGVQTSSWEFADLPGAGGIRASIHDMMSFAAAQLDPPKGALGEAIEIAWRQQLAADKEHMAMGLGWMIARDGSTRWHNGGTGGFRSVIFINRSLGAAVIVLANTATAKVEPIGEGLMQQIAGIHVPAVEFQAAVDVPHEQMQRLVGRYQLVPGFQFDVRIDQEALVVAIPGQPTQRVFAKSPAVWFYRSVDAELHFDLPNEGPATALVLHQNGLKQTAPRVDIDDGDGR